MGGYTNLFTKTNKCEQFSFSGCKIKHPLCKKYCLTKYMQCVNYLDNIAGNKIQVQSLIYSELSIEKLCISSMEDFNKN